MKKIILFTVLSCGFLAQTLPAFADATSAQKEASMKMQKEIHKMMATDEGCSAMCEEMMSNPKTKAMLVSMIKKDPEAMKMVKAH